MGGKFYPPQNHFLQDLVGFHHIVLVGFDFELNNFKIDQYKFQSIECGCVCYQIVQVSIYLARSMQTDNIKHSSDYRSCLICWVDNSKIQSKVRSALLNGLVWSCLLNISMYSLKKQESTTTINIFGFQYILKKNIE